MSEENVEMVRRGWEHLTATGDFLNEVYAPDLVFNLSTFRGFPDQGTYHGVEGMRKFMADWREVFEDWEVRLEELHGAGDKVVSVARQRGRSKESGVPVEMLFGNVITVRDGKQVRIDMYASPEEALEAAGLSE